MESYMSDPFRSGGGNKWKATEKRDTPPAMSNQHSPAAIVAFENALRAAHFRIIRREFLLNDDNEPTHWYFHCGMFGHEEPFPVVGVIDVQTEDDFLVGKRMAEIVIEQLERRKMERYQR